MVKLLTRLLNISKTMQELLLIGIHAPGVLVNDGFEFWTIFPDFKELIGLFLVFNHGKTDIRIVEDIFHLLSH